MFSAPDNLLVRVIPTHVVSENSITELHYRVVTDHHARELWTGG